MSSVFKCYIEYNDNKYDIIINDDISSVYFTDIYEKIQQIIGSVCNEEISYETHSFQIIDSKSNKALNISFDHFVRHESLIRITQNTITYPINEYQNYNYITGSYDCTQQLATNSANKNSIDSYIPHEYYCDVCSVSVDRSADPRLKRFKLNLNFESYKRYSDLLDVIKTTVKTECDSITDYEWLNIIPFKMRAFGYRNFGPKNWKNCFEYFRNKYIEALEVSPNTSTACSLFPFLHEFNSYTFSSTKDYYKKIIDLREKIRTNIHPICNLLTKPLETTNSTERPRLKSVVKRVPVQTFAKWSKRGQIEKLLKKQENEIKCFHLMIQIMYMYGIPTTGKRTKSRNWAKVSDKLIEFGYSRTNWDRKKCMNKFDNWANFYAKNYSDIIKYKLSNPKAVEVFELFKIIHTIDLSLLFDKSHHLYQKLMKIGESDEIRDYLLTTHLNSSQIQSQTNPQNVDKNVEIIDISDVNNNSDTKTNLKNLPENDCLDAVDMDLEDGEIIDTEQVTPETQPVVQPIDKPIDQPKGQLIDQTIGQLIGKTIDQTIGQPIGHPIMESLVQPIAQLIVKSIGQLIVQSIAQPLMQTTNTVTTTQTVPTIITQTINTRDPRLKRRIKEEKEDFQNTEQNTPILNKKIKLEPN